MPNLFMGKLSEGKDDFDYLTWSSYDCIAVRKFIVPSFPSSKYGDMGFFSLYKC